MRSLNCFANDIELMVDEMGEIVVIRFRVQIGPGILCWRLFEYARDRGELDQLISALYHRPIEKRSRSSTVTVYEGMYPANDEMDCNGFDQRMDKRVFV
jgi:hypothetical protein